MLVYLHYIHSVTQNSVSQTIFYSIIIIHILLNSIESFGNRIFINDSKFGYTRECLNKQRATMYRSNVY